MAICHGFNAEDDLFLSGLETGEISAGVNSTSALKHRKQLSKLGTLPQDDLK